uniref:transglutaminase-like domain-containing protein n=1 Tax=Ndongobacter massiliensis TaxID=1871025 RepID=UPI0009303FFA|nr:transglutaminase domain-containing protein [Ndongobacter massiliensis]
MRANNEQRWNLLQSWLTTALFSVVLYHTVFHYAGFSNENLLLAALCSLLFTVAFRCIFQFWKITLPIFALVVLVVALQFFVGWNFPLSILSRTFWAALFEQGKAVFTAFLAAPGGVLDLAGGSVFVLLLTSFLATVTVWVLPIPILNMALLILPYFTMKDLTSDPNWILYLLLGLYCVYSSYAYRQDPSEREQRPPILFGVGLLVLTFLVQSFLGPEFFFNEELSKRLNDWNPSEGGEVSPFSLEDLGYYPMGRRRIGGPIALDEAPFLEISAPPFSFYLRGTAYDYFDGRAWGFSERQVLQGFRSDPDYPDHFDGKQAQLFWFPTPEDRDALLSEGIFQPILYTLRSVGANRTVFHGGKPTLLARNARGSEFLSFPDFAGAAIAQTDEFLFSQNGMLIARHYYSDAPISIQDCVLPLKQTDFTEEQSAMLDRLEPLRKGRGMRQYEPLVRAYDPALAEILYDESHSFGTLVQDLNAHFNEFYRYTLAVRPLPEKETVLSDFLQTKEGYCVYFASTWTALLQDLGYDVRYVEGLLVPAQEAAPGKQVSRTLSAQQGHAWLEINTAKAGYVPVEATPASHIADVANLTASAETPQDSIEESVPPQESSEPASTSSVSDSREPEEPPAPEPERSKATLLWALPVLLLLFVALVAFLRLRAWHNSVNEVAALQRYDQADSKGKREQALANWARLRRLHEYSGETFHLEDTVRTIFARLESAEGGIDSSEFLTGMESLCYAKRPLSTQNFQQLLRLRIEKEYQVRSTLGTMRWFLHCVVAVPK